MEKEKFILKTNIAGALPLVFDPAIPTHLISPLRQPEAPRRRIPTGHTKGEA
jgi:hypothetical protein